MNSPSELYNRKVNISNSAKGSHSPQNYQTPASSPRRGSPLQYCKPSDEGVNRAQLSQDGFNIFWRNFMHSQYQVALAEKRKKYDESAVIATGAQAYHDWDATSGSNPLNGVVGGGLLIASLLKNLDISIPVAATSAISFSGVSAALTLHDSATRKNARYQQQIAARVEPNSADNSALNYYKDLASKPIPEELKNIDKQITYAIDNDMSVMDFLLKFTLSDIDKLEVNSESEKIDLLMTLLVHPSATASIYRETKNIINQLNLFFEQQGRSSMLLALPSKEEWIQQHSHRGPGVEEMSSESKRQLNARGVSGFIEPPMLGEHTAIERLCDFIRYFGECIQCCKKAKSEAVDEVRSLCTEV